MSAFSPWNQTQARTINGSTNTSVKALKGHESCENDSVFINDIRLRSLGGVSDSEPYDQVLPEFFL
jgi:hypothetical protein